jgi:hypothetical protein
MMSANISFYRIPDWIAKVTINAKEDKVFVTGKNLLYQTTVEFNYTELIKHTVKAKQGDKDWFSAGWAILTVGYVIYFTILVISPNLWQTSVVRVIEAIVLIISVIMFLLPFLVKEEWLFFYDKDKDVAFSVKINRSNRIQAEQLIEYISNKIVDNANNSNT